MFHDIDCLPILVENEVLVGRVVERAVAGRVSDDGALPEGPRAMQPIIDKLKVGFPVYWYGESAVQKFSIYAIPMIFFVKDGQIVEKLPGRRPGRELDKRIRKFLAD